MATQQPARIRPSSISIRMVSGIVEYIVSDAVASELRRRNPKHPRIRRSLATQHAIGEIHQRLQFYSGVSLSISKSPPFMYELVKHYNQNYLSGCKDLKLNQRSLWRIYFRSLTQEEKSHLVLQGPSISHKAVYIQKRYNEPDEPVDGVQKRKQAACTSPIGSDYSKLKEVITIDQSNSSRLQYLCCNLHSNYHGSMDTTHIEPHNCFYQAAGIKHKVISHHKTGPYKGISSDKDITVAFETSTYFRNLETTLLGRQFCGGLDSFELNLAKDLLKHGVRDKIRLKGKIIYNQQAVSRRITFGFGRIQKDSYQLNWNLNTTTMPGANTALFNTLPFKSKEQLVILFEKATKFCLLWNKESFPDHERNLRCAGYLNSQMGFPSSKSLFEFFDIVISRNKVLKKHIDVKNCHRPGYNICCVYSYYTTVNEEEYKVSIIMTTRTTVGSAFTKVLENKKC